MCLDSRQQTHAMVTHLPLYLYMQTYMWVCSSPDKITIFLSLNYICYHFFIFCFIIVGRNFWNYYVLSLNSIKVEPIKSICSQFSTKKKKKRGKLANNDFAHNLAPKKKKKKKKEANSQTIEIQITEII